MKRKIFVFLVLISLVWTVFLFGEGAQESADKVVTLKLGHISPAESPMGKGATRFAEIVNERTNGNVIVEVFPSEQLGPAKDQLESTMLGNQDVFLEGAVWYERWSKILRFLNIAFAFEGREHFREWTKTDDWKEAWASVSEQSGLVFLDSANWERGPFRLVISKKPVNSVSDLEGLKMRVWPSDAYKRSWEALGAKPTELAWTDVYLGLKMGTVDACTSPVNLLYQMKFTEVAKYVIYWPEFPQIVRVAMNKKKFESFSPEYQTILKEAAVEAGDLYSQLSREIAEEDIQKVIEEHDAVYKEIDLKPAAEKMVKQIRKFEEDDYVPEGIYDGIRALVE